MSLRRWRARGFLPWISGVAALALGAGFAPVSPPRAIDRAEYRQRLHGFWLAQCIANWTGLKTEGRYIEPPFLTDENWGMLIGGHPLQFVTWQNPWLADDDTDVEYVYVHLLGALNTPVLSPTQIADGWTSHINRYIWVSNARARELIGRGVLPPATSLGAANAHRLQIDAQLTTEVFGAIWPGMPERALAAGDLPIRTTAGGYGAHAAQFYAVLYSLATQVPPGLTGREQVVWLVTEARRWVPGTSKSADIVDFVLEDFLANPDVNDWERTRDRVHERYHGNAGAHGFVYRGWTESSVNFACGIMALLYGQTDFKRTVQIGTLSGWDSDNGTATMGGLLGLMQGYDAIRAAFPGVWMSDRYNIYRTRDNLPDYLPADPEAEDTLSMMADRVLALVDRAVEHAGGSVNLVTNQWILPPAISGDPLAHSPTQREAARSANLAVRAAGGTVTAHVSQPGIPPPGHGSGEVALIANGFDADGSGLEPIPGGEAYFTSQIAGAPPPRQVVLTVEYDRPVAVAAVRFIEGDHFDGPLARGGWFVPLPVELRIDGAWVSPPGVTGPSPAPDAARPFQILEWTLVQPVQATGIRVRARPGGFDGFVTCTELDGLVPIEP